MAEARPLQHQGRPPEVQTQGFPVLHSPVLSREFTPSNVARDGCFYLKGKEVTHWTSRKTPFLLPASWNVVVTDRASAAVLNEEAVMVEQKHKDLESQQPDGEPCLAQ